MRSAAAATALGITLILAGLSSCAGPQDPVQPPEPDPSSSPVFASDGEALAAAEELYGRYLDISDAIGAAGWADTEALSLVEKGDALKEEQTSAADFHSRGYRQVGSTTFDSATIQQLEDAGTGHVFLTVYLCLDVSGAQILDSSDHPVSPQDRPDRLSLEVAMDDADAGVLKIARSDQWSGRDFC